MNVIRLALRHLARHKTFSLINIGGLAISLASCVFIFYFVYDEFTYDRFHEKSARIYRLTALFQSPEDTQNLLWTNQKTGPHLKRVYPQVEEFVRLEDVEAIFGKTNKERKGIVKADPSIFNVFTLPLIEGNPNTALKNPYSIVISESLSKKYFHGVAIGQYVEIHKESYVVTGVMKDMPANTDKWLDAVAYDGKFGGEEDQGLAFTYQTYILLRQREDAAFIESKLPEVLDVLDLRSGDHRKFGVDMQPLQGLHFWTGTGMDSPKGNETNVKILAVVAIVLLLVALFNYINLTTVISLERAKEVGVRKVAGAQKGELVRQFLGESIVAVSIAAILALFITILMRSLFTTVSGKQMTDVAIIGVCILLLVIVAIVSSIYPASILSSYRPVKALRSQKEINSGGGLLRKILTTTQFGLSTALLIFLTTILYQTEFMKSSNLGFNKEKIIVLDIPGDSLAKAHPPFAEEFMKLKSVDDVGVGGFASTPGTSEVTPAPMTIIADGQEREVIISTTTADRHYTSILGLNAIEGQSFHDLDDSQVDGKAIINQSFAKFSGWKDPIGQKIKNYAGEFEIIGIIPDFHFKSLHSKIEPMVIAGHSRKTVEVSHLYLKLISNDIDELRTTWHRILPDHPFGYKFLNDYFDQQYQAETTLQTIFIYFTILTIAIAGSGLLGLTIHHVDKKTKEISIRKLLGAPVGSLIQLLSKEFFYLTIGGVVIGCVAGTMLAGEWLSGFAYHIDPGVRILLLPVIVIMGFAATILVYKTYHGSNANPVKGLKHE
jgi:putative ABC transport system permease protein